MTRESLLTLIAENDKIAVSALISLFNRQTTDEQAAEGTREKNGVGFNGTDGNILSSFAKQAIANRQSKKYPTDLSPKQMSLLRSKLTKYAGQLLTIAEERAAEKGEEPTSAPIRIPVPQNAPGFITAEGTRITDQFVYGIDGTIWPRNAGKIVTKAVGEKWGHIRRAQAELPSDVMDCYFRS